MSQRNRKMQITLLENQPCTPSDFWLPVGNCNPGLIIPAVPVSGIDRLGHFNFFVTVAANVVQFHNSHFAVARVICSTVSVT